MFGKKKETKKEEVPKNEVKKEEKIDPDFEESEFFQTLKKERGTAVFLHNLTMYSIFRKLIGLSIFTTIITIISILGATGVNFIPVKPEYIPLDATGKLLKEESINEPVYNDGYVISKGVEVVRKLNTYDYVSWKTQIGEAQKYFTEEGWGSYVSALTASNQMKSVSLAKNVVTVNFNSNANIENQRLTDMGYVWKVVVPVTIQYLSTNGRDKTQVGNAEVYFVRVPLSENNWGISVFRYNLNTNVKR